MSSISTVLGPFEAPSLGLLGVEPLRAALEYASMRFMNKAALPTGDGHPVVIFPGLATDKHSIGPLTDFCERLGYAAFDWGRGFNTGPQGDVDDWLAQLSQHVCELTAEHEEQVSLIGWSLGGIYAREVAKLLPQRVRQVITIGTPFAGTAEQTNVAWVYRLVNGQRPVLDQALLRRLRTPPPVPTTSIYSRTDGIVAWQACLNPASAPQAENVEVDGSHCGLGWNPKVLAVIADRLRQPVGEWQPWQQQAVF
jgi:predicted alpha/beta hydrolase family esterase